MLQSAEGVDCEALAADLEGGRQVHISHVVIGLQLRYDQKSG